MKALVTFSLVVFALLLLACSQPLTEERLADTRQKANTIYSKAVGRCPKSSPEFVAVENAKNIFYNRLVAAEGNTSEVFNANDVREARERFNSRLRETLNDFDKSLREAGCRPWHHRLFE